MRFQLCGRLTGCHSRSSKSAPVTPSGASPNRKRQPSLSGVTVRAVLAAARTGGGMAPVGAEPCAREGADMHIAATPSAAPAKRCIAHGPMRCSLVIAPLPDYWLDQIRSLRGCQPEKRMRRRSQPCDHTGSHEPVRYTGLSKRSAELADFAG